MKFDEALVEMEAGKSIKLPDKDYSLCIIHRIYYDNDSERPVETIKTDDMMRDDWEVVT